MKKMAGKLPPVEWNFESILSEELWACALWEFGRSSNQVQATLPNYGSVRIAEPFATLASLDQSRSLRPVAISL
jgi:hypothetical protein